MTTTVAIDAMRGTQHTGGGRRSTDGLPTRAPGMPTGCRANSHAIGTSSIVSRTSVPATHDMDNTRHAAPLDLVFNDWIDRNAISIKTMNGGATDTGLENGSRTGF